LAATPERVEVIRDIAKNHLVSGVLLLLKIVPAHSWQGVGCTSGPTDL
jgi:hypothetical protein